MRRYVVAGRWPWAMMMLVLVGRTSASCPPCPPPPAACVFQNEPTIGECLYTIYDGLNVDIETTALYFGLKCPDNISLDDPVLPALEYEIAVSRVAIINCGVPAESYAKTLSRLNVTVVENLSLSFLPQAKLKADHFEGLQSINTLVVRAGDIEKPLEADRALLNPLESIKKLLISGVLLPIPIFDKPLQSLEELSLTQCGIGTIPEMIFQLLPKLKFLTLVDNELKEPPNTTALFQLGRMTLSGPNLLRTPAVSNIASLTLESVHDIHIDGECESLEEWTIRSSFITSLPEKWISKCHQIRKMTLLLNNLTDIPNNALENVFTLKSFQLTDCHNLTTLPPSLFRDTRELEYLDLSRNNITSLPRGIFSLLSKLKVLKLPRNNIIGGISPEDSLWALNALPSLLTLDLGDNPLGDLCPPASRSFDQQNLSPLWQLKSLQLLSLRRTGAVRICQDWKRDLGQLQTLDLSDNHIEEIKFVDFQWSRSDVIADVNLEDNPLKSIILRPAEANRLVKSRIKVHFNVNAKMNCDCTIYWFAHALRVYKNNINGARFTSINCINPQSNREIPIHRYPLEKMVCHVNVGCPSSCDCIHRPKDETMVVDCHNKGLTQLPNLNGLPESLRTELNVSNNLLTTLPVNVPKRVAVLDLRSNKLSEFNSSLVDNLVSGTRQLWLRGNPLSCRCADVLPRRLHVPSFAAKIMDFETAKCSDGRSLIQATRDGCWILRAAIWGVGGAAITLMITVAVLIALKKAVRLRLKAYLLARGLCVRWVKPDDADDCIYDAFISFSHQDREYVEQIMRELESGPRPLKLCIHDRDWPIGGWIPAQIASSVAESRRTVILLSKNFLDSFWARVEFREAYARAILETKIRLIVVVLGDKPPEGLDEELQHYVTNNTYVKWGEPAFWEKLRAALPEPRPVPKKPKQKKKKMKSTAIPMPAPASPETRHPQVFVVPNPNPNVPGQNPPTPIVKFAQIDFPAPVKPPKMEASPCA